MRTQAVTAKGERRDRSIKPQEYQNLERRACSAAFRLKVAPIGVRSVLIAVAVMTFGFWKMKDRIAVIQIANFLGMDKRDVSKHIAAAERLGLITSEQGGGRGLGAWRWINLSVLEQMAEPLSCNSRVTGS